MGMVGRLAHQTKNKNGRNLVYGQNDSLFNPTFVCVAVDFEILYEILVVSECGLFESFRL